MRTKNMVIAGLAMLILGTSLWAAPPAPTTITVEGLHCMGCAKKVANQLAGVPGVAKVQVNMATASFSVSAKGKNPSPRLLWEAVERAGYKPVELAGPDGTFAAKPRD